MNNKLLARLRYVALLFCALFAILVGLLPTLLTFVAFLAVPVALLALVGIFFPDFIIQRRWARRISTVALVVFGSEFVIVTTRLVVTRRRPAELVIEGVAPRRIRVVYGVTDGARQSLSWERRVVIPRDNIAYVRFPDNGNWYSEGNPHPIRVTIIEGGAQRSGAGYWTAGGYTDGGGCHFEYDEYIVGGRSSVGAPTFTEPWPTGWLDSLNRWGVECRGGKLVRSHSKSVPNLRRTGFACYYLPEGGVACASAPRGNSPVRPQ